ncbi:MAG: PD-(D/E)XK nuclease domain-containing protein, partial [Succinivibrio sp.]|nr:PD-(D/E)XK nuclease domain-containing protein [Succinivibrio sp.]
LKEFLSIKNSGSELYYHGFMTGVLGLACAAKGIDFYEEIESGDGFSDLILDNFDAETVCILELKKATELADCYDAAMDATKQIIRKDYASKFISQRYKNVYGIGIGFAKKSCKVVSLGNLTEN